MAWPFVEMEMALVLGQLIGSENDAAMAVFQIIRRSTSQRDAISEAARCALRADDQELLSAVLNIEKAIESERNALAHGHFGVVSLLPHDFVWQDTPDYLAHRSNVSLRGHTIWNKEKHESFVKTLDVYTNTDIEIIYNDIEQLGYLFHQLLNYMKSVRNDDGTSSQLRRQLCEQPHMARELDRLRREKTLSALGGRSLPEPEC
jgi:hypothetical protein